MPARLRRHHAETLLARPVEILGGVARSAQADLHDPAGVHQPLFHDAPEGRAVRNLLTEHGVVHIGVGVHVDHAQGAAPAVQRAQDGQDDRVVAAQGERCAAVREDLVVGVLDDPD